MVLPGLGRERGGQVAGGQRHGLLQGGEGARGIQLGPRWPRTRAREERQGEGGDEGAGPHGPSMVPAPDPSLIPT
jgi:hypothetical protein